MRKGCGRAARTNSPWSKRSHVCDHHGIARNEPTSPRLQTQQCDGATLERANYTYSARCQSAAALRVQTSASRLCLRARRSRGYALERAQSHSEHSEYCEYLKYSVGSDPATTAGQTRPLAVLLIPQHSCALMRYTIPVPHGIGLVLKREMASVRAAVSGKFVACHALCQQQTGKRVLRRGIARGACPHAMARNCTK